MEVDAAVGCNRWHPGGLHRERREARADRLRGWADKRDVKAAGAFATAETIAERFPFGQPILSAIIPKRAHGATRIA